MGSKKEEERIEKTIRGLMKLPPNRRCINCNSLGPQYVCTTFWTFVCTTCSGIHREFTHRVKSVSMAKFTLQEVEALQKGGNQRAREIFFKNWDMQRQRFPDSSKVDKIREVIKNAYVDRKYANGNASDRPPRDMQILTSEDLTRRANSYHSYSQSPPYDYQYEERRYGKPVSILMRKTGSDRGIYDGKTSTFMYSPGSSSDRLSDDLFSNDGSFPRVSNYSASSGGDQFKFSAPSPNFQKETSVYTHLHFMATAAQNDQQAIMPLSVKANGVVGEIPPPQPTWNAFEDSAEVNGQNGFHQIRNLEPKAVVPPPTHEHLISRISEPTWNAFEDSGQIEAWKGLHGTGNSEHEVTPAITHECLHTKISEPKWNAFEDSSEIQAWKGQGIQQTGYSEPEIMPAATREHLSSKVSEPMWNAFEDSSEIQAWKGQDIRQTGYSEPEVMSAVTREHLSSKVSEQPTWNEPGDLPWTVVHRIGNLEHEAVPVTGQVHPTLKISEPMWNAFEDSGQTGTCKGVHKAGDLEAVAVPPPSTHEYLNSDISEGGLRHTSTVTRSTHPPPALPFAERSHPISRKSTNPFDLSYGLDEPTSLFLDMSSLHAELTNVQLPSTFVGGVGQPWVGPDMVSPYISAAQKGGLNYMTTMTPTSQFPGFPAQGSVSSTGGNPFA